MVDALGCEKGASAKVKREVRLRVYFAFDSAAVTADQKADIQRVGQFMSEYPNTSVVIEGHTDSTGAAEYNQGLSERRATNVADLLTSEYGIDSSRISTSGYGEEQPVASNDSEEGRALNRRVEADLSVMVDQK